MFGLDKYFGSSRRKTLRRAPRIELLRMIADAVKTHDGCLCLSKPVCVFADDIFGEIPVTVRRIICCGDNDAAENFDIGNGYTTEHLDEQQLLLLVEAI